MRSPIKKILIVLGSFYLLISLAIILTYDPGKIFNNLTPGPRLASIAAPVILPFKYEFRVSGKVEETGSMNESSSPYWWVNSGAYLNLSQETGKTVQGELPELSKWRLIYLGANPADTDNGYHPQNIFRLVTRSQWQNVNQQAYFKVSKINLSSSVNRNSSNGILFFSRYGDSNNLYYAGIRVDGYAVIKKKINGQYHTMAYVKVLPGSYDRSSNPNLIPINTWVGLKLRTWNQDSNKVKLQLYTDVGKTGSWTLAAESIDNGTAYGGQAFTGYGYGGIRTDFMDVTFDDYSLFK